MGEKLDSSKMTDVELITHYRSARNEFEKLQNEFRRVETECFSLPKEVIRTRLATLRVALREADKGDRFSMEMLRRLHAPLKSARLAKGLSKSEAAKRAGWTRVLISDIESGGHWVSFSRCIRMWKALELDLPDGWETLA